MHFQDEISVKVNEALSVDLPYRYVLVDGKPLISRNLARYLKNKRGF
jgi:ribosome biogenesis SPOUT family RNA methylase Rps3